MNYAVWCFSSAGPASGRRVFLNFSACSPSYYFGMTGATRRASQKHIKINESLRTRFNHKRFSLNVLMKTSLGENGRNRPKQNLKPKFVTVRRQIFGDSCWFSFSFWCFCCFRENLSERHGRMLYI